MSDALPKFVGKTMRRKRLAAGLSLDDLSNLTGVPTEKLDEYEGNSAGMDFKTLQLVADAMNEDVLCFFEGYSLERQIQAKKMEPP